MTGPGAAPQKIGGNSSCDRKSGDLQPACANQTKSLVINNPSTASGKEPLELFGPTAISAILVITGWVIVNKLQANRERRKQIRDQVANLREQLAEIENIAISYHTKDRDNSLERELITKLGRFEKSCSSLTKYGGNGWLFSAMNRKHLVVNAEAIQKLRQSMTLEHFYDEHLSAVTQDHEIVQGIQAAADVAYEALEYCRLAALD